MVFLSDTGLQVTTGQLAILNSIPHTEKERIRTQMRLLLVELLARYLPKDNSSSFAAGNAWLQDLCNQMQKPENMRQGVSRLQALAHATPEHLSRTFRKELGCTPTQYVNKLRLTYAANLLYRTDRPIIEISNQVGLTNLSYFYRIFKKQFEMTPAQFRAQKQKKLVP
jgi:AraC family cel operon transcriptional repressor